MMKPKATVMPKLAGMPVSLQVELHRRPAEFIPGLRFQAGLRLDPPADLGRIEAGQRLAQDERQHLALPRNEQRGLAVAGADDRIGLKRAPGFEHADHGGQVVVHFERPPQLDRLAGPKQGVAVFVDEHGVGAAQIGDVAEHDSVGCGAPTSVASSRPIRITCWNLPVPGMRARVSPLYSRTAQPTPSTPRTRYRSFSEIGLTSSTNRTLGSITQMSAPSMSLIWLVVSSIMPQKIEACCEIKQRGEGDTENDPDVFALVAGEHLERHPAHRTHSSAPTAGRTPSAASIIVVT